MICVSGTPGVGKSTVMKEMERRGYPVQEFDQVLKECIIGVSEGEKVVDEKCLRRIRKEGIYFGHLSHFADCDSVIVLRAHLREIEERLRERNYSKSKIMDNVECEAIDLIGYESESLHELETYEILNSDIRNTADFIENVIKGKDSTRVKIDLTEEILDWY